MAIRDKFATNAQPYLQPGERVEATFGGQTTNQWWILISVLILIFSNKYRVVVVTDRRILVLGGGLDPDRVKGVVAEVPRDVAIGPAKRTVVEVHHPRLAVLRQPPLPQGHRGGRRPASVGCARLGEPAPDVRRPPEAPAVRRPRGHPPAPPPRPPAGPQAASSQPRAPPSRRRHPRCRRCPGGGFDGPTVRPAPPADARAAGADRRRRVAVEADRLQVEHRDQPGGALLVLREVGPGAEHDLPHRRALVAFDLAPGDVVVLAVEPRLRVVAARRLPTHSGTLGPPK